MAGDDKQAETGPDDTVPSKERQAELCAAYAMNIAEGKPPYQNVAIRTRGELTWVTTERGWPLALADDAEAPRGNLAGAILQGVNLASVTLNAFDLRGTNLGQANLSGAELYEAHLEHGQLTQVNLANARLGGAHLAGATLVGANLSHVFLRGADLTGANIAGADLSVADLGWCQLRGAHLLETNLQGAALFGADLTGAILRGADLRGAVMSESTHYGPIPDEARAGYPGPANLSDADLRGCRFDDTTVLAAATLSVKTQLADVVWGSVPLTRIRWEDTPVLGDDVFAAEPTAEGGVAKGAQQRLDEYQVAARAYRQVATALRAQGLTAADTYAYRAHRMQRIVLRRQMVFPRAAFRHRVRKMGAYVGSALLDGLAGYGYHVERTILAYFVVILGFMGLFLLNAHFVAPHLSWDEALVLSVSSFHGRGFFPQNVALGDTYARLAALEAVIGLVIEVSFIATFTQRFFAR